MPVRWFQSASSSRSELCRKRGMAHHWLPHPVDIVSRQARCAAAINLAGVPRQACLFGESARRLFVYALLRRGFDIFSMRRRLGALSCRQEIESEAREGAMKTIT